MVVPLKSASYIRKVWDVVCHVVHISSWRCQIHILQSKLLGMVATTISITWRGGIFSTLWTGQNGSISQMIFPYKFSWMKMYEFRYDFTEVFPKVEIHNIPALVQNMAWCWPGDKPLSGPIMVSLLTHICVTRLHWVFTKLLIISRNFSVTCFNFSSPSYSFMGPFSTICF